MLYAWLYNTAPSPPSDVSVSQNGLDSILVSWTVSGESIVTGYIISYQQQDGVHTGSVTVDDTAVTSTIITGLMIGATYSISIVATSNTLPSNETSLPDITIIGNVITEYSVCGNYFTIYFLSLLRFTCSRSDFLWYHHGYSWR